MNDGVSVCPHCREPVGSGDEFCEGCGQGLSGCVIADASSDPDIALASTTPSDPDASDSSAASPTDVIASPRVNSLDGAGLEPRDSEPPCGSCGATIASDGYCNECGAKGQTERDHWTEQPVSWVGGVCDRGVRHRRNEDAMALVAQSEAGSFAALIVCDGVSTSSNSDVASLSAARAAREVFASAPQPSSSTVSARIMHWTSVIEAAAAAGHAQVCDTEVTERNPDLSAPACTFVAAVVDHVVITVGWVGDSRAYWFPDGGSAEALSIDHSVASDDIARGIARSVAESGNMAHAITRWFGRETPTAVPQCLTTTVTSAGWLLLCSDGLWNYSSAALDLGALLRDCSDAAIADGAVSGDPLPIAARLTNWANAQGGQDNISVVLARIPSPISSLIPSAITSAIADGNA